MVYIFGRGGGGLNFMEYGNQKLFRIYFQNLEITIDIFEYFQKMIIFFQKYDFRNTFRNILEIIQNLIRIDSEINQNYLRSLLEIKFLYFLEINQKLKFLEILRISPFLNYNNKKIKKTYI